MPNFVSPAAIAQMRRSLGIKDSCRIPPPTTGKLSISKSRIHDDMQIDAAISVEEDAGTIPAEAWS
jgi:hypothetical protein